MFFTKECIMAEEYIQTLSNEEKIVFLKLFCVLIKADGQIESDEVEFLKQISQKYGVDNNLVVEIIKNANTINHVSEAKKITNRSHALELLKELCFLANVDDSLHDSELRILIDVSRAMNIEDEKLILINRFVLDVAILEKTGRIIMEKDNG